MLPMLLKRVRLAPFRPSRRTRRQRSPATLDHRRRSRFCELTAYDPSERYAPVTGARVAHPRKRADRPRRRAHSPEAAVRIPAATRGPRRADSAMTRPLFRHNGHVSSASALQSTSAPVINRPDSVAVGVIVWLGSEVMFFAGLFAIYFTLRSSVPDLWAEQVAGSECALRGHEHDHPGAQLVHLPGRASSPRSVCSPTGPAGTRVTGE